MVKLACAALLVVLAVNVAASDYCHICKNHTMCLYEGVGPACSRRQYWGVSGSEKKIILDLHNHYRRYVAEGKEKRGYPGPQPTAANMSMLEWDNELATVAQRWADQCHFNHDSCRNVDRYHWVGQNLYISGIWRSNGVAPDKNQNWEEAIGAFYEEVKYFNNKNVDKLNSHPNKDKTGHYTQLVWAETTHVGCGFTSYMEMKDGKDWYHKFYVCNYGPGGNIVGAPVYVRGTTCSQCPSGTTCQSGLCSVKLSLITIILKTVFPRLYNTFFS